MAHPRCWRWGSRAPQRFGPRPWRPAHTRNQDHPPMIEPLIGALRDQVSGERALAAVEAVSRFHRVQASPGYDAAAGWLTGELEASGLRVEVEHAPGDGRSRRLGALMPEGWACAHARATLLDA